MTTGEAQADVASLHSQLAALRLDEVAHRRGELSAEDKEAREAFAAGTTAQEHLSGAAQLLDSARSSVRRPTPRCRPSPASSPTSSWRASRR